MLVLAVVVATAVAVVAVVATVVASRFKIEVHCIILTDKLHTWHIKHTS